MNSIMDHLCKASNDKVRMRDDRIFDSILVFIYDNQYSDAGDSKVVFVKHMNDLQEIV